MERLCQPGLKCSDFIHPHVVNKVADTCVQIRAANISRSAQVFATILLLQTVTNHTRYAKKQVWKAAEMKRLWQFKHGDWSKIIDNICTKAEHNREQMIHHDEIATITNEVRKGHSRDVVLSKTRLVKPTYRELHDRVMPQKASNNIDSTSTTTAGSVCDDQQQQHTHLDAGNAIGNLFEMSARPGL